MDEVKPVGGGEIQNLDDIKEPLMEDELEEEEEEEEDEMRHL